MVCTDLRVAPAKIDGTAAWPRTSGGSSSLPIRGASTFTTRNPAGKDGPPAGPRENWGPYNERILHFSLQSATYDLDAILNSYRSSSSSAVSDLCARRLEVRARS